MEFSRLERAAIEAILSKPVDGMEVLRRQFAAASVVKRDYTGGGFDTTISVPSSVPPMPESQKLHRALFAGAGGRAKSDPDGWVSFMLWTDAGYLVGLEGSTVCDAWPNEDDIEDVGPCEIRKNKCTQPSADNLMPDCDNRFEIWRRNTSYKTLLVTALLVLFILTIAALIVLTFIGPVV
jgi:hypothetical protein